MKRESYEHGVPSWVDLGTSDLDDAGRFYSGLFGWDLLRGPEEAGHYTMAQLNGEHVAGLGPQQNPGPPVWSTYVNVDDADRVVEAVNQAGGKVIVPPMDVMDVGRMAFFADPAGAVIGIWQPREHRGAGLVNEPGTYAWSELITTDVAGAREFYRAVFGWTAENHGNDGPGGYTEFQVGGRSIAGMMAKTEDMPAEMPPLWGVYFAVADTDATVAKAEELGGKVVMPPRDVEPGRFAVLADPQGGMFSVIAMNESTSG